MRSSFFLSICVDESVNIIASYIILWNFEDFKLLVFNLSPYEV